MRFAILALLFITNVSANDCVDCVYGLEGFPRVESISEAACSDCACYTRTHEETLKSLLGERSNLVRKELKDLINKNIEHSIFKLAELDKLAKSTSNLDAVPNCSLNQIKTRVSQCTSEAGPEKLKELFGHESVDGFLTEIGQKFAAIEGGANSSSSCLSSAQLAEMKSMMVLKSGVDAFVSELKNHKAAIKQRLDAGEKYSDIIKLPEYQVLGDITANLSENPMAMPILIEEDAIKHIIANVDDFATNQGRGIDFFTKEAFSLFPKTKANASTTIKETMKTSCAQFIDSVSEIACAGDSIALIKNEDIANKILDYRPEEHKNGFDSMFVMDKSDADPIESSYVDHIYWCAADHCSKNKKAAACSNLSYKSSLNESIGNVVHESHAFDIFNESAPSFDTDSLCKLATCSGSQDQMNACYEGVRQELGDNADSILLSYDRATRNVRDSATQDSSSGTPLFTPAPFVRSEFARSFLGEFSGEPQRSAAQNVAVNSVGTNSQTGDFSSNNSSAGNVTMSSSGGRVNSLNSGAPVVTASQAFSQFMDQRFRDIASSPASFSSTPRRNSTSVASNGSSRVEREALRSLNRASDTIDELRESYRQNAFDRMERLFEQAQRQNNSVTNSVANSAVNNSNSGTNFASSGSSSSRPTQVANNSVTGITPSSGSTGVGAGSNAANAEGEEGQVGASNDTSSAGRSIASSSGGATARVTSQNGQPTLNVNVSELPRMSLSRVENDGVDTTKPFQLAVKVQERVYVVQVRPVVLGGRKMLEPVLDPLSTPLRAQILKSPLFREYRNYLINTISSS